LPANFSAQIIYHIILLYQDNHHWPWS